MTSIDLAVLLEELATWAPPKMLARIRAAVAELRKPADPMFAEPVRLPTLEEERAAVAHGASHAYPLNEAVAAAEKPAKKSSKKHA